MKSVDAGDDYGAMREVLQRRYRKVVENQEALPDLVLVDGGKGQLSAAKSALDSLGLEHIYVIGLAKRLEEVYKPNLSTLCVDIKVVNTIMARYHVKDIGGDIKEKIMKDRIKINV